ncbi:2-phospho-L-lactate guanylyltransferase [Parahaliea aestuarii]|uniref:3-phospho-D-glycerate guanylyltransferase n=1 Tax=Parahaliea aestuarii TaxID=1852021 RepID=A0A5C8ZVF2_9GAMM|nr:2-phospho-L-lactate guanylyltransferase [Parahaliea aestuarii]TXS91447.1 2-phospho-L-lactate guanylyltransferase [Parahaliea aestuarii]
MLHAVLPLKDLVAAKTRLSGLLGPSERRALMQAMAEDVLSVLSSHPALAQVWLVSDDPGAGLLAGHFGVCHLPESTLACSGLNTVLQAACARVAAAGAERIMVLHADLPWLQATDIDRALAQQTRQGGLLIAPDRSAQGTNLLLFEAAATPQFRFGRDSCRRHREGTGSFSLLQRGGIAADIDEPRDIADLLAASAIGAATSAWLDQPGLRQRLTVAVNALGLAITANTRDSTRSGEGDA